MPRDYFMYHQLHTHTKFYILVTECISVVFMDLRANSDYFATQQKQIRFYNRDGVCLLRGVKWIFKQHTGSFLSRRSE